MAITFVAGSSTGWGTDPNYPSGLTNDDILILVVAGDTSSISGWTCALHSSSLLSVFWKRYDGSGSSVQAGYAATIAAFRGCVTGETPVFVTGSVGTNTGPPSAPSINTSSIDNAMVLTAAYGIYGDVPWSWSHSSGPTPSTASVQSTWYDDGKGSTDGQSIGIFYGLKASYGTTGIEYLNPSSLGYASAVQLALKPATGSSGQLYTETIGGATNPISVTVSEALSNARKLSASISDQATAGVGVTDTFISSHIFNEGISVSAATNDAVSSTARSNATVLESSSPSDSVNASLIASSSLIVTTTANAVATPTYPNEIISPVASANVAYPVAVSGLGTPGATVEIFDIFDVGVAMSATPDAPMDCGLATNVSFEEVATANDALFGRGGPENYYETTSESVKASTPLDDGSSALTIAAAPPANGYIRIYGTKKPGSIVWLFRR
jgi:hypothetical protein